MSDRLEKIKTDIAKRNAMNNGQRVAFALGYLRGISPLLWSIKGSESALQFDSEDAAFYDQQVDVISLVLLGEREIIDE